MSLLLVFQKALKTHPKVCFTNLLGTFQLDLKDWNLVAHLDKLKCPDCHLSSQQLCSDITAFICSSHRNQDSHYVSHYEWCVSYSVYNQHLVICHLINVSFRSVSPKRKFLHIVLKALCYIFSHLQQVSPANCSTQVPYFT